MGRNCKKVKNQQNKQCYTQKKVNICRLNEDDPGKLKQKWRNLRDSYQKAMKYKRDLEEIGQLNKYHPYRHENKMSFLLPHILADIPSKRKRTKVYDETDDCKSEK